jgi:hypothetical protein
MSQVYLLLKIILYNTWILKLFTINKANKNIKYLQQIIKIVMLN